MVKLKTSFKVIIICLLVLLKLCWVSPTIQSRIVGGKLTTIKEAPFLVRLLENYIFVCGGTLVASRYVVTASHCIQVEDAKKLTIVAGVTHSFQEGERSSVDSYLLPMDGMDVAVLKLKNPVYGLRIHPIDLCNTEWGPGADVQIFGWGVVKETDTNASNQLRTATVQVVEKDTCLYMYNYSSFLRDNMFCAFTPGLKDACVGDSGGPAIINGEFCGIVSWGEGCGRNNKPTVFMNVLAVRGFIRYALRRLAFTDFLLHLN